MSAGCFCAWAVVSGNSAVGREVARAQAGEGVVQEVQAFVPEPVGEDGDGFWRQGVFGGRRGRYGMPAFGAVRGGLPAVSVGEGERGIAVGAAFGAAVGERFPGSAEGGRRGRIGAVGLFAGAEQGGVEQGGEHGLGSWLGFYGCDFAVGQAPAYEAAWESGALIDMQPPRLVAEG